MASNNDIHIGSLIKQRLDESNISYKEFARQINCERQSLYYLFGCKSIDIDRLILISKVLNFDFIRNIYLNQESDTKPTITINIPRKQISETGNITLNIIDEQDGV